MGRCPPSLRLPPRLASCLIALALALAHGVALADSLAMEPSPPLLCRVRWDGRDIPGVMKVTGLIRHTEVVDHRSGGDPSSLRRSPGATTYEPIVLERALGADLEFERWTGKVWAFGGGLGAEVSLRDFRKDIILDLIDELGQRVLSYRVFRCWPSDYVVMGEMNAASPTAPIEALVLQHEGWERDHEVAPPH